MQLGAGGLVLYTQADIEGGFWAALAAVHWITLQGRDRAWG